ncbi:MAG: hypothetical protein KJO26_05855, partial [Deltaproteobacteria bacterium]|nr:hypothetical protein [Deltaproteobacteria bacterium]
NNSPNKNVFYGTWESLEQNHEKTVLTFHEDSLILDAYSGGFHTKAQWTADNQKIYLKNVIEADSVIIDTLTYEYKFNSRKDTLTLKLPNTNPIEYSTLIKVEAIPFTRN